MASVKVVKSEFDKWMQTMRVAWATQLAYKVNFVLLVIGPTIVFFFIKYNLWTSIYSMGGIEEIRGYTMAGMLRYQALVMVVSLLGQSYSSLNLSQDIRMGRISMYLIYPFEFWKFHAAGFLSFQAIQVLITLLTVAVFAASGLVGSFSIEYLVIGGAYTLLVASFWFSISFVLGLVAFWIEESWAFRVLFNMTAAFLSGATVPLEIFPAWFSSALAYTPFPYITHVPVKIMSGEFTGSISEAAVILIGWIVVAGLAGRGLWRKGVRLHTGAGM